ncbi:MAG: winged helix-turn-helix transcriptional regulator [Acidobacteria bacterium]|nr:winged helix-turn-helix transcriptional regulator [Acidobacteriota bacterium]
MKRASYPEMDRELYQRHAELCKVFSHPARLEILHILRREELSVSELARRLGLAIGNLSQHLGMMKQRRVLLARKESNNVFYRLANPKMLEAFGLIRQILQEQMQREGLLARHMKRPRAPGRIPATPPPRKASKHG